MSSRKTSLEKWLEMLGPYLDQLHLHDNHGTADDHLALGHGTIDFETLFAVIKKDHLTPPIITLEPHEEKELWPSVKELERLWPW